ncbi:hypothetical protein HRR93_002632 [Exophiala dermatitidis]|nr:hypothetical protein HRR93_002632 [Exophiala dermatitidis]
MVNVRSVISCFPSAPRRLPCGRHVIALVYSSLPGQHGVRHCSSEQKQLPAVSRPASWTALKTERDEGSEKPGGSLPTLSTQSAGQSQSVPLRWEEVRRSLLSARKDDSEVDQKEAYYPTEREPGSERQASRQRVSKQLSKFLPSHARPRKIDLSYMNTVDWENGIVDAETPLAPSFRSSTPLRKLLLDYLYNIEPILQDSAVDWDAEHLDGTLAQNLRTTFNAASCKVLAATGFDVTDVASWSWILSSSTIDIAVQRYTLLTDDLRRSGSQPPPKFILLQLLRASHISHFALKELIKSILTDLRMAQENKHYPGWGWVTRVSLVVRLLRHARRVAPDCLEDISLIIGHLFSDYYATERLLERPELQRLTHLFNRFLTLIALSPATAPFNAYPQQQNAQLRLVRLMVAFQPQLPLTREGYRALITVQLLHRKTESERIWAEAKSPSWPPWRQIRSGIEQDLEYPGKESRVMKLLRRMNEAGYAHGEWERSAAVLAGWDTDKSPTIQTRAILTPPPRPWTLLDPQTRASDGPDLWAARIRATRSRREAWASFCAYEKSTDSSKVRYQPYFAMLEKLLVKTVAADSRAGVAYTPGDVKEVFEDSTNPRDLIYIEKDVPSAEEFYQHMLQMGIRPGGHLLSALLRNAPDVRAGFAYVHDSRWDALTKRVLCQAEDYSLTVIRNALNAVPGHALAALIGLLARHGFDDELILQWRAQQTGIRETVTPFGYAWELLSVARSSDSRLWNALLEGACFCLNETKIAAADGRLQVDPAILRGMKYDMWWRLWTTFGPSERPHRVHADLATFRHAAGIVSAMIKDRRLQLSPTRLGLFAKSIFLQAVYGRRVAAFLPPASTPVLVVPDQRDLRLLVRVLVSTHDIDSLVALVRWLNEHAETFAASNMYQGSIHADELDHNLLSGGELPPLRGVLCAIRLLLEGYSSSSSDGHGHEWFRTPLLVPAQTLEEVRTQCAPLGWPSDAEVEMFLSSEAGWLARVAHDADVTAFKHARRERNNSMTWKPRENTEQDQDVGASAPFDSGKDEVGSKVADQEGVAANV